MTVKDFFNTIDAEKFADEYMKYEGTVDNIFADTSKSVAERIVLLEKAKTTIKTLFEEMRNREPVKNEKEYIVFSDMIEGSYLLNSYLVSKSDILSYTPSSKKRIETYAYEFDQTEQILGYDISEASRYTINDDIRYACSIFYEITFFGYNSEKRDNKVSNIVSDLTKQAEEIKENGLKDCIPAEKVFEELGFTDTRKDYEKEYDSQKLEKECKYNSLTFNLLINLEKRYIENNETANIS